MTILFWIYRSRTNKAGECPIKMRITLNGKSVTFGTGILIDPKLWDKDRQRTRGNTILLKEYNQMLLNLTTAAWNQYNEAFKKGQAVSGEMIRDIIQGKNKPVYTLLEVFRYHIENLEKRIGFDISVNTVKKYKTVETKLQKFLPKKMNRSDINLTELNNKFITELDMYMKVEEGLKRNGVVKNMQQLKRIIFVSMENGWLNKDPFPSYKMTLDDTERGYLSTQELRLMEDIQLPSKRLETVRDVFIFCAYTGLAYADVSKLKKQHFETDDEGTKWIKLNRTKTKTKSAIPLMPKAREIVDKYNHITNSSNPLALPVISNQNLNKYLKEIARLCGITKRVSMHLARHTFATTITLGNKIDIMNVSKMMGHKSVKTTQKYAKVTELKIAEDMKKLM